MLFNAARTAIRHDKDLKAFFERRKPGKVALAYDVMTGLTAMRASGALEWLARKFDYVLIDTPPLMACAYAVITARGSDLVLMVVQWRRTPSNVVKKMLRELTKVTDTPIRFVLSQIKTKDLYHYEIGKYGAAYYRRVKSVQEQSAVE